MDRPLIAPSILAADFLDLGTAVRAVAAGGADRIQLDVMDGVFVPNISFGLPVAAAVRRASGLPLEAHLMIVQPERYLEAFARAGASSVVVHQEACVHLDRTLHQIRELGLQAGVALNPATPLATLEEVVGLVDLLLIMTVNPGFGGQVFIPTMLGKIARARALLDARNPRCELEVDGGVDERTIGPAYAAGARVFVAGTAVYAHPGGAAAGVRALVAAATG